ncbi:MAG: DNA-directed RNA polymerase subunit N [Thermoproteota archaeon]
MIVPVRCYTCGFPVGRYWEKFRERVSRGEDPAKVLDELGIRRYCCRRILLTHVPAIYEVKNFRRVL